jgi:hypothetical protein
MVTKRWQQSLVAKESLERKEVRSAENPVRSLMLYPVELRVLVLPGAKSRARRGILPGPQVASCLRYRIITIFSTAVWPFLYFSAPLTGST